ncbi:3-oxoacyl-[acyl-carrier-protein] synthase III C-terminal domain-containing protein [Streptomyces cavernae]|uniref:3-oxoacyl-[acyl-carrier-protein] synthase III C-terminal domain-containing protein n=1 Tax=Streptomyces cavernae TaxID=2259034 RepID=UPI000FEB5F34|nr:3-oxoacyl-ACP synthase III family protein [Streptomyces cavernae]
MTARTALMHIAGTASALPAEPVDNAALSDIFGISEGWIDLFVGTRTRHFGWDPATGKVTHTLADLCAEAAGRALAAAGLAAADLDFLVLSTATPDTLLPTTANETADRLGLNHLPTYQIQAGCSGAVQALDVARALLASGHHAGLVVAGDVTARFLQAGQDASALATQELINYVLFGDGAAAAVVTAEPHGDAVAVRGLLHRFAGRGRPPGQIVGWRGVTEPEPDRQMLFEDYKTIEEEVPALAGEIVWELLSTADWTPQQVDFILPPQLSGLMTERIVAGLGLPPGCREVSCVRDTGNTGNALPLLQLDRALDSMAPGERALSVVVESSKWIKAGLALERLAGPEEGGRGR